MYSESISIARRSLCILGFKAMFLCDTAGKTQLMVDATIQAESGKDANKPDCPLPCPFKIIRTSVSKRKSN